MLGSYDISVSNSKLQYKFTIKRNITILKGDSGTGKTTLINMINESSGSTDIKLISKVPCIVIPNVDMWELLIRNYHNSILFFDEDCEFVSTHKFASVVKDSDCYFVIVTRKKLSNLPYSVNEVYEIIESKHYGITKPVINSLVKLYNSLDDSLHGLEIKKIKDLYSAGAGNVGKEPTFHIFKINGKFVVLNDNLNKPAFIGDTVEACEEWNIDRQMGHVTELNIF